MGLEKVIVRQVVKVAKDTGKLETALSLMEDKLKLQGRKAIEKAGFDPSTLPFNIDDLLNGDVEDTGALLKPQAICSVPSLTESQKSEAITNADNTLIALNTIIANKNKIQIALQTIKTPLQTLSASASALDNIISTVKVAVKVIKAIPIPTSVPPGVGIPINVLTILSDSLDQLDKLLTYGKGVTTVVPLLTKAVLNMITSIINKLNGLDSIIQPVITTLQFVKTVAEVGDQCPNLSQSKIDIVTNAISNDITASVAASGQNSSLGANISSEAELVSQLSLNASPGIYYKGFRLTLENNPNNEYSFPSRRISATRDFAKDPNTQYTISSGGVKPSNGTVLGVVIIYNSPATEPQGRYSYSSSTQVLFEEMKWNLDLYMQSVSGRQQAPNELNRMPDLGGDNNQSTGNSNSGTDPILPYVLNGPNVVTPVDEFTGNQVSGTIVVNEPIRVQMTTNGGNSNISITNTIISFQRGTVPTNSPLSREAYVTRGNVVTSTPSILTESGIWNYTMTIIYNRGNSGNQSNFSIETIN
tara:strand:- start:859 stop:2451 length:1593 start_codon:yes stop_codon:yes gene_type:complete